MAWQTGAVLFCITSAHEAMQTTVLVFQTCFCRSCRVIAVQEKLQGDGSRQAVHPPQCLSSLERDNHIVKYSVVPKQHHFISHEIGVASKVPTFCSRLYVDQTACCINSCLQCARSRTGSNLSLNYAMFLCLTSHKFQQVGRIKGRHESE